MRFVIGSASALTTFGMVYIVLVVNGSLLMEQHHPWLKPNVDIAGILLGVIHGLIKNITAHAGVVRPIRILTYGRTIYRVIVRIVGISHCVSINAEHNN